MNHKRKKIYSLSIILLFISISNLTLAQTPNNTYNPQINNINHDEVINQGFKIFKSQINNNGYNDSSTNFSVYEELENLYNSHPLIDFASYVENTITIKFIDGTYKLLLNQFTSYNYFDKINYSSKADSYRIISNFSLENITKKALILNPSEYMYGSRHCRKIINILIKKGYCLDYLINEDVDIPYIRDNLQAEIIYLNTHAGFWDLNGDSQGDVVVIATGEHWTSETEENYKFEFENQMIVEGVVGNQSYIAFTPLFIEYYYQENEFTESLVYMATCYASFDASMADAFLDSGANVYVGWKRNTISWTNSQTSVTFFKLLSIGIPVKFVCSLIGYGGFFNLLLRSKLVYYGNGYHRMSNPFTAKTLIS